MRDFTLSELASACGVVCQDGRAFAGNVAIDSRKIKAGDVFVALRGAHVDGHDYLEDVKRAGAMAAIVERQQTGCTLIQWEVPDAVQALGALAALNRQSFSRSVIGLTGSAGKTTTKEMIAAILSEDGRPLVTEGNLNNHLGVPLTLLRLSPEHDSAVVEMGASAMGEIRYLTSLVKPTVALVTLVAQAHIEGFGSIENIASGKFEIFEGLSEDGTAIINLDNAWTSGWLENVSRQFRVVCYSMMENADADVRAVHIRTGDDGMHFTLSAYGNEANVHLHFLGAHNVGNAVAAASCCLAAGMDFARVIAGLTNARPYSGRLCLRAGLAGCSLIDDSYNANPASVEMAIRSLMDMEGQDRILVLGDMAELGSDAYQLHFEMGELAKSLGVSKLLACGGLTRATVKGFGEGGQHYPDQDALRDACQTLAAQGVIFLIKGSRSSAMDRIVESMIDRPSPQLEGSDIAPRNSDERSTQQC